jgi:hypothetical protein
MALKGRLVGTGVGSPAKAGSSTLGLEVGVRIMARVSVWIRVIVIVDHYNPIPYCIQWLYNANRLFITTCGTAVY